MDNRFTSWIMRLCGSVAPNVPPLAEGRRLSDGLQQASVGGCASFSMDEIRSRFELVKSGKMSRDEFLSLYPENTVLFVDAKDGRFSVAVDESILWDSTDAKPSEL